MDVVPAGQLSLWRGNPLTAWIEDGRLYGRGVEDNQQDLVASLFALKAFAAEGILPAYDVGLARVADEDTGSKYGVHYLIEQVKPFRPQDFIIVPDAGDEPGTLIEVAEKSLLWLKFRTQGKQVHGSMPDQGVNSFKAASFLVTKLESLYRRFPARNPLFAPPISTFEPIKKEANIPNINTIPGEDVFNMDSRILPQYKVEDVEKEIRALADCAEARYKVKIEIQAVEKAPAAPHTAANAPVVLALKKAVKQVYRQLAKAAGIGGMTAAVTFRNVGFAAAVWSRIDDTAHQPNEYCVIDNMVGDAKVFAHVFLQK